MDPIQVSYRVTPEGLAATQGPLPKPWTTRVPVQIGWAFAVGAMAWGIGGLSIPQSAGLALTFAVLATAFSWFQFRDPLAGYREQLAKGPASPEDPQELTLSAEGVAYRRGSESGVSSWGSFDWIHAHSGFLALRIPNGHGFAIPVEVLPGEAEPLADAVRGWRRAEAPAPPPVEPPGMVWRSESLLNADDLRACTAFFAQDRWPNLRRGITIGGTLSLALGVAYFFAKRPQDSAVPLFLASVGLVGTLYAAYAWNPRFHAPVIADTAKREQSLLCGPSGLFNTGPWGHHLQSWRRVQRVVELPTLILIYTSDVAAHVVPKRDIADVPAFLRDIEAWRAASR